MFDAFSFTHKCNPHDTFMLDDLYLQSIDRIWDSFCMWCERASAQGRRRIYYIKDATDGVTGQWEFKFHERAGRHRVNPFWQAGRRIDGRSLRKSGSRSRPESFVIRIARRLQQNLASNEQLTCAFLEGDYLSAKLARTTGGLLFTKDSDYFIRLQAARKGKCDIVLVAQDTSPASQRYQEVAAAIPNLQACIDTMKQLLDIALGDASISEVNRPALSFDLHACIYNSLQSARIFRHVLHFVKGIDLGKHHAMYNPLRNGLYKLFGHDYIDCYVDGIMAERRTLENDCKHTLNVQAGNLTPEANSGMAVLTSAYDLTEKTAAWWNDGMSLRMRLPRS
eukprot:TRINITY_DN12241_c0_g1_i11.p1 TRINITY_DN12241_c0_g1~~TRINITY_DN12241_c0_g1_i11.p1  ORF type:complete len:337 (+),score=55.92 TRINITY_DN12241_c0_g1_i11:125-1135(+)